MNMTTQELVNILFGYGTAIYRGFRIDKINQSADGRGNNDFYIEHLSSGADRLMMRTNIKHIKEQIDSSAYAI